MKINQLGPDSSGMYGLGMHSSGISSSGIEKELFNSFNGSEMLPHLESPSRILHHMVEVQGSGKLTIYDPQDPAIAWQIYMGNGQVHFASSNMAQFERLRYLQREAGHTLVSESKQVSQFGSDYEFLCAQWQARQLTLSQLRSFLSLITQDALIQVLKLPQATIQMNRTLGLDPILMSVPLINLVKPVQSALHQWQSVHAEILSPLQRPFITDQDQWQRLLHGSGQALPRIHFVGPFLEQNFCIYQIAQEMGVSMIEILPLLQNLVWRGLIEMRPYKTPQLEQPRPLVACIDSDPEVQGCVKVALESLGYQVLALCDPARIGSVLARCQPEMLLLDVDHLEGYGVAKSLLNSEQLKQIPIVALTERQSMVHRFRAWRTGAVNCLTKPFEPSVLNQMVKQLTQPATYAAS